MYERIAPEQHDTLDGVPEPSEKLQLFGHDASRCAADRGVSRRQSCRTRWCLPGRAASARRPLHSSWRTICCRIRRPTRAPAAFAPRDPASPLYRQVASGAHPSVLHLTRPLNEKTKAFKTALTVDEIRRVGRFLSLTAHDGGYRVVIVDPADDMNVNAANALLKNLEEPPSRTVFMLIAHSPGGCCRPSARAARSCGSSRSADDDLLAALAAVGKDAGPAARERHARARRRQPAQRRSCSPTMAASKSPRRWTSSSAASDPAAADTHRLADAVAGRDQAIQFGIFNEPRARHAGAGGQRGCRARRQRRAPTGFRETWQNSRIAIEETETYNLDRKQHVLSMIARLNDTFRM